MYLPRDVKLNDTFEYSNKYSGFTNWGECLDQLRNYYLVKKIYWRKVFDIYIHTRVCVQTLVFVTDWVVHTGFCVIVFD